MRENMLIDDMQRAVREAELELIRADECVGAMVKLIVGKLRRNNMPYSYIYHLAAIKKELRKFNAHTKRWED